MQNGEEGSRELAITPFPPGYSLRILSDICLHMKTLEKSLEALGTYPTPFLGLEVGVFCGDVKFPTPCIDQIWRQVTDCSNGNVKQLFPYVPCA